MSFCAYPFVSFSLQINHAVRPCCAYTSPPNLSADDFVKDPLEHLNHGDFYDIRQRMLNGEELIECKICHDSEKIYNNGKSKRTRANDRWKDAVNSSSLNQFEQLRFLEIMIDNLCNFECRTCSNWFSTKLYNRDVFLEKNNIKKATKADLSFLRVIDLSHLEQIHLQGGEPFLTPNLEKIIDIIEEQKDLEEVVLSFNTNGSVLPSDHVREKLLRFKHIKLDISLDSTHKVNDYIRYRGDKEKLFENARYFDQWPNTEINFNSTISVYNADTIPQTYKDIHNLGYYYDYGFAHKTPSILDYATNEYREWLFDRVKNTKFETLYRNFYKNKQHDEKKWNAFIDETKKLDEYYNVRLADYHPDLANFLNI
jgi:MoaA/NifB/PqqE/SkfB family radical SAM enzyme